jgi:predicted acyltransferase (DUF342 family)
VNGNLENRNPENILPTKMVKRQTIILKSRFDQSVINQIAEKLKDKLFTRINFLKSKFSEIKLISVEKYYEEYLIIKGKYSLDHCKKLEYNLEVDEKTEKVCILNEEIVIDKLNELNSGNSAFFKLSGVAHFHFEKNGHYVLDIKGREIESESCSILLDNVWPKQNLAKSGLKRNFSKIKISTQKEIDFLRSRIVKRPPDVGEVIKEIFEVNERNIILYPMYKLEYENIKNKKEALVKINGITGKILITTFSNKTISGKFIEDLIKVSPNIIMLDKQQSTESVDSTSKTIQPIEQKLTRKSSFENSENANNKIKEAKGLMNNFLLPSKQPEVKPENNKLEFPGKAKGDIFHVGDEVTAIIGDLEIPPETAVDETLVVKGNLKIGERCEMMGTIKALGNISLGAHTIVKGNVVSDGTVSIGSEVKIFGKVVSQKTIDSEESHTR